MVLGAIEKVTGLPKLSEVQHIVSAVNDLLKLLSDRRLHSLKQLTDNMLKLQTQGGMEGLRAFTTIVQVIASVDTVKMDKLDVILRDAMGVINAVQRLVKSLPEDAKIDMGEIAKEITKSIKGG